MFSPDEDDDHSFSPNRRVERNKRRWSHKTLSDGEESEISSSKCKRSLNYKNDSTSKNSKLSNSTISTSNNNSLSHPALSGKKSGISHSTPINDNNLSLTPTKGRRSLIIDKLVLQDDDEFNDDAEELRVERENQISAQDSALEPERGLKSLEILAHCLDNELSSEQLANHLANCIELHAANKININNAFNLKLIDYMVVLLKRNDQTMKDFPTMSCSLDASTRIYACRVDNVHAGVMELATGLVGTLDKQRKKKSQDPDNQNNDNSGDEDEDEGGRASRRGKTKKRKSVLASSEKAVSRNNIELAHWISRRAIEPNFTVLLNTAKMTQSFVAGLSLLKDSVPLIPEKSTAKKAPLENSTVQIEFPGLTEAHPSLFGASFRFNWDEEAEKESQDSVANEFAMEADPVDVPSFAEDLPDILSDNDDGPEMDFAEPEEPEVEVLPLDTVPEVERRHASKRNSNRKDRVDALNIVNSKMILADSDNDYSYINTKYLSSTWAGPDHWKPVLKRGKTSHFAVAEYAEKKVKKLKKKSPEGINFDDFSTLDSIYSKKVNDKDRSKAVKKWTEAKVTLPIRIECKPSILYRSFLRKTLFWKPLINTEDDSDDFKVEVEYADDMDDLDDISDDNDNNIADGIPDFQEDDDDEKSEINHENFEINHENIEINHEKPEISLTSKLVPAPKMVDFRITNYATVPKRVDMKKLKETLWTLMDFESDKENQDKNSGSDNSERTVQFSKLYLELPKHLSTDSRNDLSPALAFLAILDLASIKMLQLCPVNKEYEKDNSDFLIKRVS